MVGPYSLIRQQLYGCYKRVKGCLLIVFLEYGVDSHIPVIDLLSPRYTVLPTHIQLYVNHLRWAIYVSSVTQNAHGR
jgi:hypothetical protein